jgi:type IV pilus assembly protein PilN
MYSLDVNFLKDRHLSDRSKTTASKAPTAASLQKQIPLLIGLGVGAGLLTITGLIGIFVNWQKTDLQNRIQGLDSQLEQLKGQNKNLGEMKTKLTAIEGENQALVSVFNQIRPWSALLQEIRRQIPPTVQIQGVQQIELPAEPDKGEPLPRTQLKITGFASNYEAVNNYLLTLQASPFLKAQKTAIESALLADIPLQLNNQNPNVTVTFPKVVQYTIATELNDTPASKQLPHLARNGAIGAVTRIQTLKRQGALQP